MAAAKRLVRLIDSRVVARGCCGDEASERVRDGYAVITVFNPYGEVKPDDVYYAVMVNGREVERLDEIPSPLAGGEIVLRDYNAVAWVYDVDGARLCAVFTDGEYAHSVCTPLRDLAVMLHLAGTLRDLCRW